MDADNRIALVGIAIGMMQMIDGVEAKFERAGRGARGACGLRGAVVGYISY